MSTDHAQAPAPEDLYREADRLDLTPGWVRRDEPILWAAPRTAFHPASWRYDQARDALDLAGRLIPVELAERRNLILRNPFPGNQFATCRTLISAYQMILPGEVAPTHRHTPHALRVMLDARGSFSVVEGVRVPMETGDVVLTPGGMWHGHGHDGDRPAYWLDVLDVPLVALLEPMFYEDHPDRHPPATSVTEASPYRFARADIERRLDAAEPGPDGTYGPRITLDTSSMPSMGLTVQRLGAGARTRAQRSTANRIVVVLEGAGSTTVGGTEFPWTRGDTVVVPTWHAVTHRARSAATLVEASDEPAMRSLGYYRRELDPRN